MEGYDRRNGSALTWDVIAAVQTIAERRGLSMAQIAIAWVNGRPGVTSTILGARTIEQLDDNLGADGLHLTADEIDALDEASDPRPRDYPYGELGVEQRGRDLAGS
jgi:aryl-alcohol dehydrogenase-like predicted oxidoreductase